MLTKLLDKYKALATPIRASLWAFVCGCLQKGVSVITTPIFTRIMTTAEFGEFGVYTSWMSILAVFATMNLYCGVYTQGMVKFEHEREKYTSALIGLTTLITAGLFAVYLLFSSFWSSLTHLSATIMCCIFVSIWCNAIMSFWSAKQRIDYKYRALVVLTLIATILKPTMGIASIYLFPNAHVEARIISITVVELLAYVWLFVVQLKRDRRLYDKHYWGYALKFNLPLVPHYLSQTVLSSSDRIMIENYCGKSDAGLYSLAYSLAMLMVIVNIAIDNTFNPWLYKKIHLKQYNDVGKYCYTLLIIVAAANLALIAIAPEAVAVFAPAQYREAIYSIPPVAMSCMFMFMYGLFANFAFYYEKTKLIMLTSVVGAALNIALNAIFIPMFGYAAAAYTTLVCYMLYALCHYILMRGICKKYADNVKVYTPAWLLLISAVFIGAGFALMLLYDYVIPRYAAVAACLVFAFIKRKEIIALFKRT